MTKHVFEINYEAPHDCCLTDLHCKDSPFAKAKNTNLELRNRDLFKRNVELIEYVSPTYRVERLEKVWGYRLFKCEKMTICLEFRFFRNNKHQKEN